MIGAYNLGSMFASNAIIFCAICIGLLLVLALLTKNSEAGGKFLLITLVGFTAWYIYTHFIATGII